MAFTIITLDGAQLSTAGNPTIGNIQLVVAGGDGSLIPQPINRNNPMPTAGSYGPSLIAPVEHDFNADGEISPVLFAPIPGRPFNMTLSFGASDGTRMALMRTFDDGDTFVPVTNGGQPIEWVADASENDFIETEVGVKYALKMVARNAGAVATRISQ